MLAASPRAGDGAKDLETLMLRQLRVAASRKRGRPSFTLFGHVLLVVASRYILFGDRPQDSAAQLRGGMDR